MKLNADAKSRLAAEWVLGTQTERVRRRLERLRGHDAAFAREIAVWERRLAALPEALAPAPLEANHWQRIERELQRSLPLAPAKPQPFWQQLWFWRSWSLVATAATLVFAMTPLTNTSVTTSANTPSQNPIPISVVTEESPPAQALERPVEELSAAPSTPPSVLESPASESPAIAASPAAIANANVPLPTEPSESAPQAPPLTPTKASSGRAEALGETRGTDHVITAGGATVGPVLLALLADEHGQGGWLVRIDEANQRLTVRPLVNTESDHDFQLWAVADDGATRSLGVLPRTDGSLDLSARQRRALQHAKMLAVSIEPPGGAPGDGPTGKIAFTGSPVTL